MAEYAERLVVTTQDRLQGLLLMEESDIFTKNEQQFTCSLSDFRARLKKAYLETDDGDEVCVCVCVDADIF